MTRVLTAPGVIDLGELTIVKGLFYWKIGIDIQVFGDNGNVYDLAMLSVVSALHSTRIPCTIPVKNYEQEEKDFEIDDDATHFRRINCMAVPISISMSKVVAWSGCDCRLATPSSSFDSMIAVARCFKSSHAFWTA